MLTCSTKLDCLSTLKFDLKLALLLFDSRCAVLPPQHIQLLLAQSPKVRMTIQTGQDRRPSHQFTRYYSLVSASQDQCLPILVVQGQYATQQPPSKFCLSCRAVTVTKCTYLGIVRQQLHTSMHLARLHPD